MKPFILIALNVGVIGFFVWLSRKKNLLSSFTDGKWWLTWFSIAIITLMDELTSIFYVPAESYRILNGVSAFVFIIGTSLLMRFLSNRMVEIAHILEHHNIKGGGVYSFSYLVLGPTVSFIAVASILVDYILTAAISTVSAVQNGTSFMDLSPVMIYVLMFAVVWGVAGLNILGIKENARFTFFIFFIAAVVLLTLIASGIIDPSPGQGTVILKGFADTWTNATGGGFFSGIGFVILGIAGVILAYSGIESVVQTAALVKSWKDIRKAYLFLALTVGIFTPLISMVVLTRTDIVFHEHETDLLTHFASILNGPWFGILVGGLAFFLLTMAVNTAFVASSELLERVAHRYGFHWLSKTNKRESLYRIHIMNAIFFSLIISVTAGSQSMLAEMYAVGLVASFTINMGALVIYRYKQGSGDIKEYFTSRTGTVVIFAILLACFGVIAYKHWMGFLLWIVAVIVSLIVGLRVAKRRAPEIVQFHKADNPLDLTFQIAEAGEEHFHIFFKRPKDKSDINPAKNFAYVTFYSPRLATHEKLGPNHYLFPLQGQGLSPIIHSLISNLKYDFPKRDITFHLGWPTSSWIDRLSIGVMVLSLMRLPKAFPEYNFVIEYSKGELKG
jgi:amino acid transporter